MNLFRSGQFTLASGERSWFKIDCDALTDEDWATLAAMASSILPVFSKVEGVPRGGRPFAEALKPYAQGVPESPILIAEDVVTSGQSMERQRDGRDNTIGVAVFARYPWGFPEWVRPLFIMPARSSILAPVK